MERGWAEKWRANGWMNDKKKKAKNPDLWSRPLDAASRHEVRFEWAKGHAGNLENERCHRLAPRAARKRILPDDEGYERA